MAKQKFYVVWVGKKTGVYESWAECKAQVDQFDRAKYKSYPSMAEAKKAYEEGWKKHWGQGSAGNSSGAGKSKTRGDDAGADQEIDYDSISVDVGTRGNPGIVEYKGVDTRTGEVIFSHGPIQKGTNNLGEFLAIVHGLAHLKQEGSSKTVYSDSVNAIKWVKQKEVSSTLMRDSSTEEIWTLVDRALKWLNSNRYDNKLLKWQTKSWGENKADYGRK